MDDPFDPANTPGGATVVTPQKSPGADRQKKRLPRYNVLLWDSDDHTFEYVERMLRELFGHKQEACRKIAETVDTAGKAVVFTTTLEHAELKRDQIHAYGTDAERANVGSMWATVEEAD